MKNLMWAGLAAGCLLASAGISIADDTVRLGGPSGTVDMLGDIDLVRGGGHGGGGHGGGGHGGYGHGGYGHGGYGHGGYGYGRGYGYGYGRGYGYAGYGRGWGGYGWGGYGWGGYGWGGYGWGGYGGYSYPYAYPVYYPYYIPSYPSYYYPIAGQNAPTVNLQANYYSESPANNQPFPGTLPLPGGNGTYPYDGGPRSPIPMPAPGADANPANDRGLIPLDGKLVSFPSQASGGFYPVGLPDVQSRSKTNSTPAPVQSKTAPAPRVVYPAYGETPR